VLDHHIRLLLEQEAEEPLHSVVPKRDLQEDLASLILLVGQVVVVVDLLATQLADREILVHLVVVVVLVQTQRGVLVQVVEQVEILAHLGDHLPTMVVEVVAPVPPELLEPVLVVKVVLDFKHQQHSEILHNLMGHQDQVVVDIGLPVVVLETHTLAEKTVVHIMELPISPVDLMLEGVILMEMELLVMMELQIPVVEVVEDLSQLLVALVVEVVVDLVSS